MASRGRGRRMTRRGSLSSSTTAPFRSSIQTRFWGIPPTEIGPRIRRDPSTGLLLRVDRHQHVCHSVGQAFDAKQARLSRTSAGEYAGLRFQRSAPPVGCYRKFQEIVPRRIAIENRHPGVARTVLAQPTQGGKTACGRAGYEGFPLPPARRANRSRDLMADGPSMS